MRRVIFLIIILFSVFVLSANKKKKNADNFPLLYTKWVLTEIFETPAIYATDTAFITFLDNYRFSGHSGCNLFFGEFNYSKKRLKLDYLGASKMYCKDMSVEEQFLKAIKLDKFMYYIEKNTLFLLQRNSVICKFEGTLFINDKQNIFNPNENQQLDNNHDHSD